MLGSLGLKTAVKPEEDSDTLLICMVKHLLIAQANTGPPLVSKPLVPLPLELAQVVQFWQRKTQLQYVEFTELLRVVIVGPP